MMITAIVTVMVTVIVSTVARYVAWQLSVLGRPLYMYIFWHLILFVFVLAIFYERRHGFEKSIAVLGYIARVFEAKSQEGKVNATMAVYREHAAKFKLKNILLPIAIVLFAAYVLSAQLLFFAIVSSGSMQPTFNKGDLVLMQNIVVTPKIGDIVIYSDPKTSQRVRVSSKPLTITHRIVEMPGDKIKTKGDNNPYADSWSVTRKELLGKAIILGGKPIVLKDVGKYFLLDYTSEQYSVEFLAISKTIQNMRSMGIMIFFMCLILYLALSLRDSRTTRQFKYR